MAGRNLWGHRDLNDVFLYLGKSGNFEKVMSLAIMFAL